MCDRYGRLRIEGVQIRIQLNGIEWNEAPKGVVILQCIGHAHCSIYRAVRFISCLQCCFNFCLAHHSRCRIHYRIAIALFTLLCVKLYRISLLSIFHFNHKPIHFGPYTKLLVWMYSKYIHGDLFGEQLEPRSSMCECLCVYVCMENANEWKWMAKYSLQPLFQSQYARKNGCRVPFHLWVYIWRLHDWHKMNEHCFDMLPRIRYIHIYLIITVRQYKWHARKASCAKNIRAE